MRARARAGFTLIELMIVVAIIGILASIAIPKFADLIRKSNEGSTRGNLGAFRSAIGIYYSDMEGQFPSDPASLTIGGRYLRTVPLGRTPSYHADSTAVALGTSAGGIDDSGAWIYDDIAGDQSYGQVFVNCSHTDTKGSRWEDY